MIMSAEEEAYWEAENYFHELDEYIEDNNGRFFFGSNNYGTNSIFKLIDEQLPRLKKTLPKDSIYYRSRISKLRTGHYEESSYPDFEAFSLTARPFPQS